jgi:hypothetical protein
MKKLNRKYGKLTVLSEETIAGRRVALVNCTCGQQKQVMVDALTSGRTKSCGAPDCKYGKARNRLQKGYTPRGSRKIPKAVLRKIVLATTRKESPMTVADAAQRYDIAEVQTLYSALRAVRKSGGWDRYSEMVP